MLKIVKSLWYYIVCALERHTWVVDVKISGISGESQIWEYFKRCVHAGDHSDGKYTEARA